MRAVVVAVAVAGVRLRAGGREASGRPMSAAARSDSQSPAMATRLGQLSPCGPALIPPGPASARDGLPLAQRPPRRRDVFGQVEVRLAPSPHWTPQVSGATLPSTVRIPVELYLRPSSSRSALRPRTARHVTSAPV